MGYTPLITIKGIDLEENIIRQGIEESITMKGATHVRTHSGAVWKIFDRLNKKSVPLNNAGNGPQRIGFAKVESFGILEDEEQGTPGDKQEKQGGGADPGHSGRDHAFLSASSAHRWLNCTPAPHLEAQYPDSESDAAAEGTAAHELAEHKLRLLAGLEAGQRPQSDWLNEEMDDYTDSYADHVMAELHRTQQGSPAAFLAIEQRLDFSHLVPDGFGTGDALIVGDGTMTIIDLKYGKGVEVSADNNPQMRLYALGALNQFGMIYNIQQVRMVIFQPRLNNISVDEVTVSDLLAWADEVVKPRAKLAIAGEGKLTPGTWCQFCRHAPNCPALATQHFDVLPAGNKPLEPAAPNPDTLTDDQIAQILTHANAIKKWLTAVEKHALDQANNGHAYPGMKLVEGRSVRKYADEDKVAAAVEGLGEDPWERKLLGITAMTKKLGKKRFDETVGPLLDKPAGKPTLVPLDDKRPALQVATASTVFQAIEG